MRTEDPRAIQLADYQAPDFHIETVKLDFALDPQATQVMARLEILRKNPGAALVLQGYRFDEAQIAEIVVQFSRLEAIARTVVDWPLPFASEPAPVFRP